MKTLAQQTRTAARALATASGDQRSRALSALIDQLNEHEAAILAANGRDVACLLYTSPSPRDIS